MPWLGVQHRLQLLKLSSYHREVGVREICFEACSAFTSLRPICSLSRPRRPFDIRSFSDLLPPRLFRLLPGGKPNSRTGLSPAGKRHFARRTDKYIYRTVGSRHYEFGASSIGDVRSVLIRFDFPTGCGASSNNLEEYLIEYMTIVYDDYSGSFLRQKCHKNNEFPRRGRQRQLLEIAGQCFCACYRGPQPEE